MEQMNRPIERSQSRAPDARMSVLSISTKAQAWTTIVVTRSGMPQIQSALQYINLSPGLALAINDALRIFFDFAMPIAATFL